MPSISRIKLSLTNLSLKMISDILKSLCQRRREKKKRKANEVHGTKQYAGMWREYGLHPLKKFCFVIAYAVGFMFSLSTTAKTDELALRKIIEATYPNIQIISIQATPYGGLYEVYMQGQIIYTDARFSFLIANGRLIDAKTKQDITHQRLADLNRVDFDSFPLEMTIKVVKGNGNRKLIVFSDPDCSYCKQLEQKVLAQLNNITIYTFLFPLKQIHPDAMNKAKTIWCAENRTKAWQDWILTNVLPKGKAECEAPLQNIEAIAEKLEINSTPTLILQDGRRILGVPTLEDLEKLLATKK